VCEYYKCFARVGRFDRMLFYMRAYGAPKVNVHMVKLLAMNFEEVELER
jgi:hypothetical protein